MVLILSYPLSEREFNSALLTFNSGNALFNYLEGTGFGIESSLDYKLFSTYRLLTVIRVITESVRVVFGRRLLSPIEITSGVEYKRWLGSQTRFSKIYLGWNR